MRLSILLILSIILGPKLYAQQVIFESSEKEQKNHLHIDKDKPTSFFETFTRDTEICDNGIDDDGDGWVDFFDPDCAADDNYYMAQPEVVCNAIPDLRPLEIREKWSYGDIGLRLDRHQIVAGDIDGDGEVEVITGGLRDEKRSLFILDGQTGVLENERSFPEISGHNRDGIFFNPCIADIDGDGFAEIFLADVIDGLCILRALSHKLETIWKTSFICSSEIFIMAPNIADLNEDGFSDLYIGGHVFNAHNGKMLFENSDQRDVKNIMSVAADFLPDYPGLEVAFGNHVYAYELNNLNAETNNYCFRTVLDKGGLNSTAVADVDGDEALDIIFTYGADSQKGVQYLTVWNPRTESIIASKLISSLVSSVAFCADLDNDCLPEVGITSEDRLNVLDYDGTDQLKTKYFVNISEKSARTSAIPFDFDDDGKLELVFRDQQRFRILNGRDGSTISSFNLFSQTWYEYPVIVDIDNDGAAEILVNGKGFDNIEVVMALESGLIPWSRTRSVWNQTAYSVTNINDDLSVPTFQQNTSIQRDSFCVCPSLYNSFLSPANFRSRMGCLYNPAVDVFPEIKDVACDMDSLIITYRLSNLADQKAIPDSMIVALFSGNPLRSSAQVLMFDTIKFEIDTGEMSPLMTITLPKDNVTGNVFLLANVSPSSLAPFTLPMTKTLECNYDNNLDSIAFVLDSITIDLGRDSLVCANQMISFEMPEGYDSYLWSDGSISSNFSTSQAGVHWVEVRNFCGQSIRDSIQITIDPKTQVKILGDTIYCEGDYIDLTTNYPFDFYQWSGLQTEYCLDCRKQLILAEENMNLILEVNKDGNCFSSDSIRISVRDTFMLYKQAQICPGDSIFFGGSWLKDQGSYVFRDNTSGCDSTVLLELYHETLDYDYEFNFECTPPTLEVEFIGSDISVIWPDGQIVETMSFYEANDIIVKLESQLTGCIEELELNLPGLPIIDLLPESIDTLIFDGSILELDLGLDEEHWTIDWTPEEAVDCAICPKVLINNLGHDDLTAEFQHIQSGCKYSIAINIDTKDGIYIPNSFSPNGDGKNDLWQIYHQGYIDGVAVVQLYNRWGDEVFAWKGTGLFSWDGSFNGSIAESGVYVYYIELITESGNVLTKQGDLTLVR